MRKAASALALACAIACAAALCCTGFAEPAAADEPALTAGRTLTAAASAKKAPVADGVYLIRCKCSGKALAAAGGCTVSGANAQQAKATGGIEQLFSLKYDAETRTYRIMAVASGLFLDVEDSLDADGANVRLRTENGTAAQRWRILRNADGTLAFRSETGRRVLDVESASRAAGANVQLWRSNGSDAQKWRLKAVSNWLPDGVYAMTGSMAQQSAVAVKGGSQKAGANIRMAQLTVGDKAQQWVIKRSKKTGFYTIANRNSKLYLSVDKKAKAGANVRQRAYSGALTQLWKPEALVGGIRFVSAAGTGVALEVAGAGAQAGANVRVAAKAKRMAQKFRLRDATLTDFKVYLNPGHGWNDYANGAWDSGAQGNGYSEAELTHDLTRRVQAYCETYGIEVVNGEQFHFDVSGIGTSGTHTMVGVQGKAAGSDLLNDIIHRRLVAALGLRDLGTFSRSDITAVNGAIPSMLMEVCFVDNPNDVATFLARRDQVARAIAAGIYEASLHPSLHR